MRLEICLDEVGRQASWRQLGHLRSTIGLDWVRRALHRADAETIRRRKLPHEAVVWLVIGIALFRERSIDAVVKHLELARSSDPPVPSPTGSSISSAAIAQARHRIGSRPLAELFNITAQNWTSEFRETNRWRDLQAFAIDGSGLRIADTPANEEFFGRPGSGRSKAAYPQARIVAVLAVGSRIVCDAAVGDQQRGEQSLARDMIERMPDRSVLILDRGFVNHTMFARTMAAGTERHFLCRAKANLVSKRVRILARNDSLVQINLSAPDRRKNPELPETITVRLIKYTIPGFRSATLVTSLLDPARFPRSEIVELYHKRWEIETAYDEIKTHTLEREETIRSRSPELVLQEIYGLLVAYNLLRVVMARAAAIAGVTAARMSFRNSLLELRDFYSLASATAPGNVPALYRKLCGRLALLVLPERRSRSYPRVVKIKMSNYKRKDF